MCIRDRFNGTGDQFVNSIKKEHFATGGMGQYWDPTTGPLFQMPNSLIVTNQACVDVNGSYQFAKKQEIVESLCNLPPADGNNRLVLPPILVTLGQHLDERESEISGMSWYDSDDWNASGFLDNKPVHLVGPSIAYRNGDDFVTTLPATFALVARFLQQSVGQKFSRKGRGRNLEHPSDNPFPSQTIVLNQGNTSIDEMIDKFALHWDPDKLAKGAPSFELTFNLFLLALESIKNDQSAVEYLDCHLNKFTNNKTMRMNFKLAEEFSGVWGTENGGSFASVEFYQDTSGDSPGGASTSIASSSWSWINKVI